MDRVNANFVFYPGAMYYGTNPPVNVFNRGSRCRWIYMGNNSWQWVCFGEGGGTRIGNGNFTDMTGSSSKYDVSQSGELDRNNPNYPPWGPIRAPEGRPSGCNCENCTQNRAQMACSKADGCVMRGNQCYCNGNEMRGGGFIRVLGGQVYSNYAIVGYGAEGGEMGTDQLERAERACEPPYVPWGFDVCAPAD